VGIEKLTDKEQKQQKIVEMFDDIASTYDLANRVLSMGIDKQWRRKGCDRAFDILNNKNIDQITDVACGTGDLLLFWKEYADKHGVEVKKFVGVDPSVGMLEVARKKIDFAQFLEGKAQELPVEDNSTEIISISYGIRNVVDRVEALHEFYRALKPGGIVVILEFTKNESTGYLAKITDFYLNNILPKLGGFISKNKEAYTYLPDSIEDFTTTKKLTNELLESGFNIKEIKAFSFDISTMFIAQK